MLTLEEARKHYPDGEAPPDDVLRQILKSFYCIVEMEWQEMMDEKVGETKKRDE